jgi:hypothetical protein
MNRLIYFIASSVVDPDPQGSKTFLQDQVPKLDLNLIKNHKKNYQCDNYDFKNTLI